MIAFAAAFAIQMILFFVVWMVLDVIGKWFLFNKMGEPGWKSLIPVYSEYVVYKNVWQTGYFFAFVILSCVAGYFGYGSPEAGSASYIGNLCASGAFIMSCLANIKLSRSFGHGYLFAFGLLFFNPIFTMILGFGNSRYYGNTTVY